MAKGDNSKKSPAESFSDMIKEFGNAVGEIFNDPNLKKKAREFGDSAADSAKAFGNRFKDEEVKNKFKNLGETAKDFGQSVSDYFKDDKEQTEKESKKKPENETKEALVSNAGDKNPVSKDRLEFSSRTGRITGYSFAIAWSIAFIVFFNFFNRYIAYYEYDAVTSSWNIYPFITSNFNAWLPVLNAALIASIVGNIILIFNDSFYFNHITNIVMHFFGIASIAALLVLFPFDFNVVPEASLNAILFPILKIVLILIIVGLSIGILVRFIKVIIRVVRTT
jgi:hypothetical protein